MKVVTRYFTFSLNFGCQPSMIEIPKPRWTAYDAKFFGIEMPDDVAMTVQDRAYTSPI